jgi:hypothetical protein
MYTIMISDDTARPPETVSSLFPGISTDPYPPYCCNKSVITPYYSIIPEVMASMRYIRAALVAKPKTVPADPPAPKDIEGVCPPIASPQACVESTMKTCPDGDGVGTSVDPRKPSSKPD